MSGRNDSNPQCGPKSKLNLMLGPDPSAQGGIASVIAVYRQARLIDGIETEFLPTFRTGRPLVRLWVALSALMRVTRWLLYGRVRLLHVHVAQRTSFYRKSLFVALAGFFGVPVILHLHSGEFEEFYERHCGPLRQAYVRWVLRRASVLIALSGARAQWLARTVPGVRVEVIHNPLLFLGGEKVKTASERGRTVLYMGRMTAKKGIYDFLEALRQLNLQGIAFEAIVCGTGEEEAVRRYLEEHRLSSLVTLAGWVTGDDKRAVLESAAVFVLPSYFEGQPMAVLEAMACGTPVVCTRVGGVPDVIIHEQDGLLVEAGDVPELARAILRLLNDPPLRDELASSAAVKVRREFSAEHSIAALRRIYAEFGG
jgi:glycosyltransferase involved in cell wall biosynthesis